MVNNKKKNTPTHTILYSDVIFRQISFTLWNRSVDHTRYRSANANATAIANVIASVPRHVLKSDRRRRVTTPPCVDSHSSRLKDLDSLFFCLFCRFLSYGHTVVAMVTSRCQSASIIPFQHTEA